MNAAQAQLIRSRMMDRAELAADGNMVYRATAQDLEKSISTIWAAAPTSATGIARTPKQLLSTIKRWREQGITADEILAGGLDKELNDALEAVVGTSREAKRSAIETILQGGGQFEIVQEADGVSIIRGANGATLRFIPESETAVPILSSISVSPEARRQGMASQMFDQFLDEIGSNSFETTFQTEDGQRFFSEIENQGLIRKTGERPGTFAGRNNSIYIVTRQQEIVLDLEQVRSELEAVENEILLVERARRETREIIDVPDERLDETVTAIDELEGPFQTTFREAKDAIENPSEGALRGEEGADEAIMAAAEQASYRKVLSDAGFIRRETAGTVVDITKLRERKSTLLNQLSEASEIKSATPTEPMTFPIPMMGSADDAVPSPHRKIGRAPCRERG